MRKSLRGFTFIEVIIYIGLFSILGTALFAFAWDSIGLSQKSRADRTITDESRFVSERIKSLLRNASGVDEGNSVWDSTDGKLVIDLLGTSDTVTIERQNERVIMQVSGQDPIPLHSQEFRVSNLTFERFRNPSQTVSFVDVTLTLETQVSPSFEYAAALTLKTGAFIRNVGL